jgi:hypothetical protein
MVEKQFWSEILMYQNLGGGRNVKNQNIKGPEHRKEHRKSDKLDLF